MRQCHSEISYINHRHGHVAGIVRLDIRRRRPLEARPGPGHQPCGVIRRHTRFRGHINQQVLQKCQNLHRTFMSVQGDTYYVHSNLLLKSKLQFRLDVNGSFEST